MNLCGSDAEQIQFGILDIPDVFGLPLQMILVFVLVFYYLGFPAISGLIAVVLSFPLISILFSYSADAIDKKIEFSDSRIKILSEYLQVLVNDASPNQFSLYDLYIHFDCLLSFIIIDLFALQIVTPPPTH